MCSVDIGDGELKTIVCGGINLTEGMRVAVSCPGAVVRWHGEGEPVVIKNSKLRGVASYGMICASDEIGLGDLFPASQEAEILDLSAFEVPAGTPLADALDMNDVLLEIDNKSMTNRPDLWGHYGIARELAALYNLPLAEIKPFHTDVQSDFHVEIAEPDRCRRYIGVEMSGLEVKPSPYWMQSRIWKVGMRPINALVDITNYVMLATGNPTHAFDADNITDHIVVRHAEEGEKLILLNEKELDLCTDDLVITDSEGPVALAGVMGGAKDSILPDTKRVILEVANFEAAGIRRTALRYDTRTEASARYEKAIDPERCDQALALSMQYFQELYPGVQVTGYCDNYVNKLERAQIDVDLGWLAKRLGKNLSNDVIQAKLELLGFDVQIEGGNMHVTAPSWRSTGDISIKDDVMEEVARLYGYDNFEATSFTTTFEGAINQKKEDLIRNIKEYLAIRCGLQEGLYLSLDERHVCERRSSEHGRNPEAFHAARAGFEPYPFFPASQPLRSGGEKTSAILTTSPFSRRRRCSLTEIILLLTMRRSPFRSSADTSERLLPAALKISTGFSGDEGRSGIYVPLYPHGSTFLPQGGKACMGGSGGLAECIPGRRKSWRYGLLAKKASMECGIKNLSVMLFELDAEKLQPLKSRTNHFTHLAAYPETDYDISMLFDSNAAWTDIHDAVMGQEKGQRASEGSVLRGRIQRKADSGRKEVRDHPSDHRIGEKTLTSQEIESAANQVMKKLEKKMGAQLRTQ